MCIVPRPARKFHCCLVQRRGCVQEGTKLARENHVDLILAVGGGSVSDCCKVVSAQAKVDEDLWELENVKHTRPSEFIPLGTIVTVFGTGSEMNNGAVITQCCTVTCSRPTPHGSLALHRMSGASTRQARAS